MVADYRPDVIINNAQIGDLEQAESDPIYAREVNSEAPLTLALAANAFDSWLVQLSSCYVFEGNQGPYTTDHPLYPVQWYGVTKMLGENVVRQIAPDRSTVVRLGWLYGYGYDSVATSVVLYDATMATDYRSGALSYIPHVATRIAEKLTAPLVPGVFHLGPHAGSLSWYQALKPFRKGLMKLNDSGVGYSVEGVRPRSLGLVASWGWDIPDPEWGVEAMMFQKATNEQIAWSPTVA
jgi:dTDP-4-dehydrorhamnose reductase